MARGYRQLRRRRLPLPPISSTQRTQTGQIRIAANPAVVAASWKQPVNQFLRNRVPKRQMPHEASKAQFLTTITTQQTIGGQIRVGLTPGGKSGWTEPVNQPLRSRIPKRQMPVETDAGQFLVTKTTQQTIGGQIHVSPINYNPVAFFKPPTVIVGYY